MRILRADDRGLPGSTPRPTRSRRRPARPADVQDRPAGARSIGPPERSIALADRPGRGRGRARSGPVRRSRTAPSTPSPRRAHDRRCWSARTSGSTCWPARGLDETRVRSSSGCAAGQRSMPPRSCGSRAGRPRHGARHDARTTCPAEAGIVDRAVSFTKGCYVGQEPVARMHYNGHPNRHLRGLRLSQPAERGARRWWPTGKAVGAVTLRRPSPPPSGAIALGARPARGRPRRRGLGRRGRPRGDRRGASVRDFRNARLRDLRLFARLHARNGPAPAGRRWRSVPLEARKATQTERRRYLSSESPLLGGPLPAEAGAEEPRGRDRDYDARRRRLQHPGARSREPIPLPRPPVAGARAGLGAPGRRLGPLGARVPA